MKSCIAAFVLVLFLGTSAFAGPTRTIDGDTFEGIGDDGNVYRYRIWGIDAPESRDVCPDGYPAGRMATETLDALLSNAVVSCNPMDTDRYGRVVAVCRADGQDIARLMVMHGYAWDWPRYSNGYYAHVQSIAEQSGRGLWAHGCRWGR